MKFRRACGCIPLRIIHLASAEIASTSQSAATVPFPIEVRDLAISFGDKQVLAGISFQVKRGETLVLLGVSGSGKSVLLKLIAGLLKPDAGSVLIDGWDTVPLRESQLYAFRKQMGIVFQEGAVFDSLSVYENVAYPLREAGQRDEETIEREVRRVLSFVELEDAIGKMPAELSGGMRRRVSLARAIVNEPAIMLYDSPTAGLDPLTATAINILIVKMRDSRHVSSLLVTQRIQDALFLNSSAFSAADRALVSRVDPAARNGQAPTRFLVLRDARVYFLGSLQELAATEDEYLKKFIS